MRVLLTGATGFLGKRVLNLLLGDERIDEIQVISRSKRSHPSSKIKLISGDLSDPASLNGLDPDVQAVVHLAGLYDFTQGLSDDYNQNVLPTANLLSKVRAWNLERRVPLYFASTYGVGFGNPTLKPEEPLAQLPPRSIPYVYTKGIAERAVTDAGLPGAVFRLGILVGDTARGEIERVDGPYTLMRLLESLGQGKAGRVMRSFRKVPIPGKKAGILPLVPVDAAARVVHRALFAPLPGTTAQQLFGVYNAGSVPIGEFCEEIIREFLPGAKPVYFDRLPPALLRAQSWLTDIPEQVFRFSLEPVLLDNPGFVAAFGADAVPEFQSYRESFINGFRSFMEGRL